MSDDKTKRGQPDRSRISGTEAYEVDYAARKLAPEFPNKTRQQIERAIIESTRVPQFHNNRDMVLNSSRLKLRSN